MFLETEADINQAIIEQLTVVSKLLIGQENTAESLPRHIMPVLAYLVRELISGTKSTDLQEFLHSSDLENSHKATLVKLIQNF